MAQMAVESLDGVQGALKQLAVGYGIGMHLRNVKAFVQDALYHTKETPEIIAAAGRLLRLADEFGQRHGGVIIGQQAKSARDQHLAEMQAAYLRLRLMLQDAKPSAESVCLGG